MSQMLHWLAMGGYGLYVWPAYGLATSILVLNYVALRHQTKKTRKTLARWFKSATP